MLAQESASVEEVRALNGEVLRLFNRLQSDGSVQATNSVADARALLEERRVALIELIEQDPKKALLMAFSPDLLRELASSFPQLASKLESHGNWQGVVRYGVGDGVKPASSQTVATLSAGSDKYFLHFTVPQPARARSGDIFTVRGLRAGDRIAVDQANVVSQASWADCATVGGQKVAVILVNLKSYPLPATMTPNLVTGIVLGNSGGGAQNTPDWNVDDFWQQNSDGQTWVKRTGTGAFKVVGPYTLPDDYNSASTCNLDALRKAAYAAADGDLNYQDFSRVVIIYPPNVACNWSGWATIGCWGSAECPGDGACNYSWAMLRADRIPDRDLGVKLAIHELGHNLGLLHANSRDFGTDAVGPIGSGGTRQEYGDTLSTMGYWNFGFYNADAAIERLGWLGLGDHYLDVTSGGSYSIQWFGARPAGLKALRIHRGASLSGADLIVELRRNRGIYDSQLPSQVQNGALFHYRDGITGGETHLLDFTPSDSFDDAALPAGQSWRDPYSDLNVRVDSIVNDTLNLTVNYGTVPCTRALPTVEISPSNPSTKGGTPVNYTVSVRNNDSTGCAAGTFILNSTRPEAWPAGTISPSALILQPGTSGTATLRKTPPVGTMLGTFGIDAIANHVAAGLTGAGNASCTVIGKPVLSATLVIPDGNYKPKSIVPISVTAKRGAAFVGGVSTQYFMVRPDRRKNKITLPSSAKGNTIWYFRPPITGLYTVYAISTKGTEKATSNTATFTVR